LANQFRKAFADVLRWTGENPLLSAGLALLLTGLCITIGMGIYATRDRSQAEQALLVRSLDAMDRGQYAYARQLANNLRTSTRNPAALGGGPAFVLGASSAYEAESMWDERYRAKFYLVAARYLNRAHDEGWPAGREAEGLFLLGKSLYQSGQRAESIPILEKALQRSPKRADELLDMLSSANQTKDPPELASALHWKRRQLGERQLSGELRALRQFQEGEILYGLGDFDACRASLDKIPSSSPYNAPASILRARILLDEGDRQPAGSELSKAKYNEALRALLAHQSTESSPQEITRTSSYLTGIALRKLGRHEEAGHQLSVTRRSHHGTPESLAAGLDEAEVLLELGQSSRALEVLKQVIREAGDPGDFENPWLSLDQLQQRILQAFNRLLDEGHFAEAIGIAQSLEPVIPRVRAVEAEGTAQRRWGHHLLEQAKQLPETQAAAARSQAYQQLRLAGSTYATLANLRFSEREYPNDLWNSATSYLEGHDFQHAVRLLRAYLDNESRRRRPNAMAGLGRALLALGKVRESIAVLEECIEFHPKDPVVYEARLLASRAYAEIGDVQRAQQLLLDTIHNAKLTPKSVEWRDSLFELGKTLYREASIPDSENNLQDVESSSPSPARDRLAALENSHAAYQESIRLLSEAVERYPDAPQALEARYLIAQAHRRSAWLPNKKRAQTTIGPVRVALRKQEQAYLQQALESYRQLQVLLTKKQEDSQLNEVESSILRNCYYGQGDALLSLGRYEEAIRVYSAATSRYQQRPEAIEAFCQIADCYRRLQRVPEARGTIEQAKVVLGRMGEDVDFTATTRYTRAEWSKLLDWMSTL
jgi:tetratricopeptide (TPR) repeat protein